MPDQKIIDRIKKLLELASSPNENEAKLAMDQAMRLMAKYSIDESTIKTEDQIKSEIIEDEYKSEYFSKPAILEVIPGIIAIISPLFGTYGLVNRHGRTIKAFKLVGFKSNIEITKYALDSLLAQGMIDARKEYKKYRTTTFSLGFWTGFADGLRTKFGPMHDYTAGIIPYDKVKEYVNSKSTGTFGGTRFDGIAYDSGVKSGMDANIRSAITHEGSGKLLK